MEKSIQEQLRRDASTLLNEIKRVEAENKQLRAENEKLRGLLEEYGKLRGSLFEKDTLSQRIEKLEAENERLQSALKDAAKSLQTISVNAGRNEYMEDFLQVRGYANSRAVVAREALSPESPAAPCIECGETGNHSPLCISGNRFD